MADEGLGDLFAKLTGAGGQERYQLWPERVARSLWQGVTAPGRAAAGEIPIYGGVPSMGIADALATNSNPKKE